MDLINGNGTTAARSKVNMPAVTPEEIDRGAEAILEQRNANMDRYGIKLRDDEYYELNKILDTLPENQREDYAYSFAKGKEYSKILGISFEEAMKNMDNLDTMFFGTDRDLYPTSKGAFTAIRDSWNMGQNTIRMGELGQLLMNAEANKAAGGDNTKDEQLKAYMQEYQALLEDNAALQDKVPRGVLTEIAKYAAQSAPFTIEAIASSSIPVVGGILGFQFSSDNAAGLEYMDLRQNGCNPELAANIATISGGIQGIIEIALGNVAGAMGAQGKSLFKKNELVKKLTENVAKKFHFNGTWRAIATTAMEYGEENIEEGLEEVLQQLTSYGGQYLADALSEEYNFDITPEQMRKELWENFKGGFAGSLLLGLPTAAVNMHASLNDVMDLKKAAVTIPSDEAYRKAVADNPIFEGMTKAAKEAAINDVRERSRDKLEESYRKQEQDITEVYTAEEIMEVVDTVEDEEGEVISEEIPEVYKTKEGRLYTENNRIEDNKGKFTAGNPETKKNYGYIDYTVDDEAGVVTIDTFKMVKHRDAIRNEFFIDFVQEFNGYDIEWDPKLKLGKDIKSQLEALNPQGTGKGLSFFSNIDRGNDADIRLDIARQFSENTNFTAEQQLAGRALLDVIGKHAGGLEKFMAENFKDNNLFADESYRNDINSQLKRQASGEIDTLLSGKMTGDEARALGLREDQAEVVNKALANIDDGTRQALKDYALYKGGKADAINGEQYAKAEKAIKSNTELAKVMIKAGSLAGQEMKGATIPLADGIRKVIYVGENGDFSTFCHELAHVWRQALSKNDLAQVEKAFGVKDGKWTTENEENFARGFEQYLITGKAANEELKNIFTKIAEFLKDVYNSLRNLEAQSRGFKLNDDIVDTFNRLLSDDNSGLNQEVAAQEEAETVVQEETNTEEKPTEQKPEQRTTFDEVTETAIQDIIADPSLSENEKNAAALNAAGQDVAESIIDYFDQKAQEEFVKADEAKINGYTMDDEGNVYDMLFQLIGEQGMATLNELYNNSYTRTRMNALENAQKLDAEGYSVEEIYSKTQWKKNTDLNNTWWTEIADGEFKDVVKIANILNTLQEIQKGLKFADTGVKLDRLAVQQIDTLKELEGKKLSDLFDAKDVYRICPALAEVKVHFTNSLIPVHVTLGSKGMNFNLHYTSDINKFRDGIIHEIQRVMQGIEVDFDGGQTFVMQNAKTWIEFDNFMKSKYGENWAMRSYEFTTENIRDYLNSDQFNSYRTNPYEEQARTVVQRANMTDLQRRNQLLGNTEDVARNDQIVLFQTDEEGLKNSIEVDDRSLVGLHNLSEEALKHTVKMGGLANPSMAVIDTNKQGFTNFGGVTLIAPKTLIAKDTGRNAGTFGADVYSPRYPSITRQVTATGRKKIRSIFWAVEDENLKEHLVENTVQKFENDRKPDFEYTKLPIAYLAEKGNKEFWKYQKSKYDDEVKEAFKALKSNSVDDPETAKFLKDLFDKTMKGDYEEEIKDYEEMLKDENLTPFKRNIYKDNLEKAKARLDLAEEVIAENTDPNTGYLYFSPAEELRYGIEKDIRAAGKVDENATERAARELVENDPDFKKWAEEKYASVEADEKIFDGFTPSGNRKYLKHTLENVSKYMKKEGVRGGESFSYGMGSTRARVTPKWSMLKDIVKNKSRLVSKEDFEKIKNELEPIYDKYVEICDNGDGIDVGEARLNEALETKNPITYLKNEYDIEIADKDEFNKFVGDLKAMPTEYFETKFTRPVYLNEFYGAVIPKNASAETRKTLEDAGLIVKEYEEGSDRLTAIKEIGRAANGLVMFQTAYHGTSADFDEFNLDYGLSGEGSMSFGYGVYVTGSEDIAREYAERQRKKLEKDAENPFERDSLEYEMFEDLRSFNFNKQTYKEYLLKEQENIEKDPDNPYQDFKANEKLSKLDTINLTNLYTVEIPDEGYIKWDRLYKKEDIPIIAKALRKEIEKDYSSGSAYIEWEFIEELEDHAFTMTGANLLKNISYFFVGSDKEKKTSKYLNRIGYVGIDYPAGTIYGNGKDARNYVIFNEKDAKIVNHILYQTEEDLKNLAQQFDSWQDFMEYFEAPFIDENMAAMVPPEANTSWYQNYWEIAHNITPTTEEMQQEAERNYFNNEREDTDPVAADSIFLTEIRTKPGMLETFLKQIDEVMKINADDWANDALDEQDREDAENIRKVQQQIRGLHNQAFIRNAIRVAGGKPLSDKMRKNILTAIRNATRSYRGIYATVMSDNRFIVDDAAEQAAMNELAERGKKAGLEKDPTLMSPTERIKYADDIREKEIAEEIRKGTFKYDDEAEFYIKRQREALNRASKEYKELKTQVDEDFNALGDVIHRDLMKLYGKLLDVKAELEYRKMNVPAKLERTIENTAKYNRDLSALQDKYSTLYTKYKDAEKAIEVTAEFRQKLDHLETYKKAKAEYKQLRKEQRAIDELRNIRKKLVKRTMRSVDFKNVEYEHAKALIALQRIFDPNMRQGVNKWIGIEEVNAREIWSDYRTDEDEKKRITEILTKSPSGADLLHKLDMAKNERDFDLMSDKDKKTLERRLANSDWIKKLQFDRLKYGREQAIQLDITEVERKLPTGEIDHYGNEKYTNELVAEYSDEVAELLEKYFPDDLIQKIQGKAFQYWTIAEMEDLAKTFQDVYTEGRNELNAKKIREETEAYRIRELIANQVRDTGIVINQDDPEDVKKKKEEKIAKILGTNNAVKGLFEEKENKFISRMNSILHGYHDANIRRVARILDGYNEGTCTAMLYWKENECYTRQETSKNRRIAKVAEVMAANNIDVSELYKEVEINYKGEKKRQSIDKLLFIAQAVANNEAYRAEQTKQGIPANRQEEESGYQAVVYGCLMTASEKQKYIDLDNGLKEQEEARKAELALAYQTGDEEKIKELQKVSLETHDDNGNLLLPGREKIKQICKERLDEFMKEYDKLDPKFKALQEAIAADYDHEFERINRASVEEFNMPVWREKWYLPLIRKGATGDTHEARVRADLMGTIAGTGKAGTEKGFTQKRVRIAPEHQTPVELGLYSTWADSVTRNEHFINYASYVRELNRLFANKDAQPLMQEIQDRYGRGMKNYIDSYIKEVANPNAGEPVKEFDKVIRFLRGSTAPAYLGFKASSVIKQALSSPAPFMQFVSPVEYTRAAIRCINADTQKAIQAKSVFMRNRVFDPIVDVVQGQKNKATSPMGYKIQDLEAKGMQALEWIDWACVAPGWLAVYEKERARLIAETEAMVAERLEKLKELNNDGTMGERRSARELEAQARAEVEDDIEAMSVNKADDCTRLCQPSNRKVDLAPMFKNGSELQKAVLQFQTALNVIWQNIRYDIPYAVRNQQYKQIVGMTLGYVMAGIAMGVLADGFGGDEDAVEKLRRFTYYSLTQFTDSAPVVGSMITATAEKVTTGKTGYQGTQDIFPTFTKVKDGVFALTDENYQKAATKFAEGMALSIGLPTSGAKELGRAFGIGDGEEGLDFYPEAFLGRRKE